jgi:hypothetical protein
MPVLDRQLLFRRTKIHARPTWKASSDHDPSTLIAGYTP